MKKRMLVTIIIEVHPRHSQGWIKEQLRERLEDFAPVKHLEVGELNG